MRLLFFILLSFNLTAQQLVTLCDDQPQTYFYFVEASEPGNTEWNVNGIQYNGNPIGLTWSDTGIYVITAIHYSLNCQSEPVIYTVTVKECEQLIYYIPNSFTPDGDEYNQLWGPVFTSGFDPFDFRLMIFNRWGETIWESWDVEARWDGTYNGMLVPDGTYTWIIWFGDKYNDARYTDNGHVTILR